MTIKAILTDFDGVLRHWDPTPVRQAEAQAGLPAGSVFAAAFAPELLLPAIRGEVDDGVWRTQVAERLPLPAASATGVIEAWSLSCGEVVDAVAELLQRARRTCQIVLVTNATSRLPSDLAALGLTAAFDHVVSSAELGCEKPREAIYREALRRAEVRATEALFVDDAEANVHAAHLLGLRAHHFTDPDSLEEALIAQGIAL